MKKNAQVGECINIYIPLNKTAEFWEVIESEGYEKTSDGVLNFILESVVPDDEEIESGSIAFKAFNEWTKANPEQWANLKEKSSAGVRSLMDTFKKWKTPDESPK